MSVRAALVTGASSGIGEACARRLDAAGWRIYAGVRREEDAERLRRDASDRLTPLLLDVTDPAAIDAAATAIGETLHGLVNNAGIAIAVPLEFLPLEELRRQLEVNVVGQLAVTQALLPALRRGSGRIVIVGSIGGRSALPFLGAYAMSKFALEALADSLRVELLPFGIPVSIVEPGSIATPIWVKSAAVADEIAANLPPTAAELYGERIAAFRRAAAAAGRRGAPPDEAAKAIEHALVAPKPRTRYLVGRDAKRRAKIQLLPDRLRDRLIVRALFGRG